MTARRLPSRRSCASSSATLGISLAKGGNMRANNFNGILAKADGTPHQTMVSEMVLRSQSQAIYSPENIGHFGLNLMKYAHFTSPIRRYADLIVHRALVGSLGFGEGGMTPEEEGAARRYRRRNLDLRAPGHGSRARDSRPADRASPGRPRRRGI